MLSEVAAGYTRRDCAAQLRDYFGAVVAALCRQKSPIGFPVVPLSAESSAMLSPQLLERLRDWYQIAQPSVYSSRHQFSPMTPPKFNRIVHETARLAGLPPGSHRTRCGIRSPRTCSSRTSMSA